MTETDATLLAALRRGTPEAQRRFYERYAPPLYGICLRYARGEAEAQDWLQESWLRIFRDIGQFRGNGSLEGWLRRVTVHTALGQLRKRRLEFPEILNEGQASVAPSALDILQAGDIAAVIRRLPSGYQAVFNLYAIEGYRHAEIAGLLGISEGTSRSQYARARRLLQQQLSNLEKIRRHEQE